jgi:hypothetical protein
MAQPQTLPEDHDAQRTLEQRSLRNVRALIDKLEAEARADTRTRNRIAWIVGVVIALSLAGVYAWTFHRTPDESGRVIVIPAPQQR